MKNISKPFTVQTENNLWVDIHCIRTDIEYYNDIDFLNEQTESKLKLELLRSSKEWVAKLVELENVIEKQNSNSSFFINKKEITMKTKNHTIEIIEDSGAVPISNILDSINCSFNTDIQNIRAIGNHEGHLTVVFESFVSEEILQREHSNIYQLWCFLDNGHCSFYKGLNTEECLFKEY